MHSPLLYLWYFISQSVFVALVRRSQFWVPVVVAFSFSSFNNMSYDWINSCRLPSFLSYERILLRKGKVLMCCIYSWSRMANCLLSYANLIEPTTLLYKRLQIYNITLPCIWGAWNLPFLEMPLKPKPLNNCLTSSFPTPSIDNQIQQPP